MHWDLTIRCSLDTSQRSAIAQRVLECLNTAVANSSARLRGSLADGRHDVYSDIDVLWVVDDLLEITTGRVRDALSRAGEVVSLQVDPEVQRSPRYRLIFARFANLPLFWRLELKISSRNGVQGVSMAAGGNEPAPNWSVAESALANAVGAIKAYLRGKEELASEYLQSACEKLGYEPVSPRARDSLMRITKRAAELEPHVAPFAEELKAMIG